MQTDTLLDTRRTRLAIPARVTETGEQFVRHVAWPSERLEDLPTLQNLQPVRFDVNERPRRELPTLPDIDPLRHDLPC